MDDNTSGTVVTFHNPDIRLGFHIGKEKTLYKSFHNAIFDASPLRSFQLYISNGRAYKPPKADPEDIRKTHDLLCKHRKYACVHGCLLYNLAGSTDGTKDPMYGIKLGNTINGMISELDVATGFGAGVVVHIGTQKDSKKGLVQVSRSIEKILTGSNANTKILSRELQIPEEEFKKSRKIILENAAGEKNKLGSTLDEISIIIRGVREDLRDQVKVCIDTAHIFGAGQYDFGNSKSVAKFFSDFDEKIGIDKLELFHLNDSRVPYGSHKDRHENIGLGYIFGSDRNERDGLKGTLEGLTGLVTLIDFAEQHRIPLIGEPPHLTKDKEPGPGGIWDYAVIREICNLETNTFIC